MGSVVFSSGGSGMMQLHATSESSGLGASIG
jgi:hypothetical protein